MDECISQYGLGGTAPTNNLNSFMTSNHRGLAFCSSYSLWQITSELCPQLPTLGSKLTKQDHPEHYRFPWLTDKKELKYILRLLSLLFNIHGLSWSPAC